MAFASRLCSLVALILAIATLTACSATSRVVRTYEGEARPAEQVAMIFKPEDIRIESIDGLPVKSYLLNSLEMMYEILPGERTVAFRYESIWASPGRKEDHEKQVDVVRSDVRQVTFNAQPGHTYSFDFVRPNSRAEAERLAPVFHATLVDQDGAQLAVSQEAVEPVKGLPPGGEASAAEEKLSNLDALKLLWEKTSAEEKKEFLRWAFQ